MLFLEQIEETSANTTMVLQQQTLERLKDHALETISNTQDMHHKSRPVKQKINHGIVKHTDNPQVKTTAIGN